MMISLNGKRSFLRLKNLVTCEIFALAQCHGVPLRDFAAIETAEVQGTCLTSSRVMLMYPLLSTPFMLLYCTKESWMFGGLMSEAGFDRSHGILNGTKMAYRLGLQRKPFSSSLNVALA